jgi:putative ABC transport system substrate-binding protein
LVASIAKPGGNVTGLTTLVPQLTAKRLEILAELTRSPARIAFLRHPGAVNASAVWEDLQRTARQLNVTVSAADAREAPDVERALAQVARDGARGLLVDAAPILFLERRRIFEFASKHRLPTVYFFRGFVDAGGLVSYGPDFGDQFRRAASYIDRILKGANPGDLPVEQPSQFELVINMKTATATGITIPRSLLLRADRVIE